MNAQTGIHAEVDALLIVGGMCVGAVLSAATALLIARRARLDEHYAKAIRALDTLRPRWSFGLRSLGLALLASVLAAMLGLVPPHSVQGGVALLVVGAIFAGCVALAAASAMRERESALATPQSGDGAESDVDASEARQAA